MARIKYLRLGILLNSLISNMWRQNLFRLTVFIQTTHTYWRFTHYQAKKYKQLPTGCIPKYVCACTHRCVVAYIIFTHTHLSYFRRKDLELTIRVDLIKPEQFFVFHDNNWLPVSTLKFLCPFATFSYLIPVYLPESMGK